MLNAAVKCFLLAAIVISTTDRQLAIRAGYLHRRIISQKRISPPGLLLAGAFQEIAVLAGSPKYPHDFDRGKSIRQYLPAYGNTSIFSIFCDLFYSFIGRKHNSLLLPAAISKARNVANKNALNKIQRSYQGRVIHKMHPRCHLDS